MYATKKPEFPLRTINQLFILIALSIIPFLSYAQPNEVVDIEVFAASSFGQANDIWQSFTPTQDGRLVSFTFEAGGNTPAGIRTINIFEGEGVGGALLQTFSQDIPGNIVEVSVTQTIDLPLPVPVTAGNLFTFQVTNINPRTLINTNPNTYTEGTGFATFNGNPFTNFDLGFSIILDIGINVAIEARDAISTTSPFIFDVEFFGDATNLELSDFMVTNGTASNLNMLSSSEYELQVTTTGDGTAVSYTHLTLPTTPYV